MGLRINTNVASLTAQNNLKSTTSRLNQSLTRLSTGLRINTGKDDVVGLVRSELLRGQIRGLDIAQRNVSNATAFMGVAEGYLSRLTELAQQMRESAVQAAESTIDPASRNALVDNFEQLIDEYNRLTVNANFNGVYLLDGTFVNKELQVGANEGDNLQISISDARSASIGEVAIYTTQTFRLGQSTGVVTATDFTAGTLSFNKAGTTYTVTEYSDDGVSYIEGDESALAYVNAINGISGSSGVIAKVNSNIVTMNYSAGAGNDLISTQSFIINGVTVKSDGSTYSIGNSTDAATMVNLINDKAVQTGVTATLDTANSDIILTATDGRNITLQVAGGGSANFYGATTNSDYTSSTYRGTFRLISEDAFTMTTTFAGLNTQTAGGTSNAVQVDNTTSLVNADLSDADSAGNAITILDNVLSQLQGLRAEVGSTLTRLDLALTELRSRQENLMSAESLIRDADIAVETARLTQDQILQQAGVTVLAQANASPQIALALLSNLG